MRRRLAAIAARTSSLGVKQTLHVWHTKHKPKQIVSSVSQQSAAGFAFQSSQSVVVPTKKIGLQGILDYYVERTKQ